MKSVCWRATAPNAKKELLESPSCKKESSIFRQKQVPSISHQWVTGREGPRFFLQPKGETSTACLTTGVLLSFCSWLGMKSVCWRATAPNAKKELLESPSCKKESSIFRQKKVPSISHSRPSFKAPTAAYVVAARAAVHTGELHTGTQRARDITARYKCGSIALQHLTFALALLGSFPNTPLAAVS